MTRLLLLVAAIATAGCASRPLWPTGFAGRGSVPCDPAVDESCHSCVVDGRPGWCVRPASLAPRGIARNDAMSSRRR